MADDPRPTYSDKKYKTYEDFRKDVKAWRIRNGYLKENKNTGGSKNKKQNIRGTGAKNTGGYKRDPNNPQVGDTKKTRKTRKKGGWTGGETLYWNGSKWVKKGDSSLVPNRAVPGDNKADPGGYKRAVKTNKSLKINSKKEEVKNNSNNNKNVSKENNKEDNKNNEKEVKTEKSQYPVVTQEQLDKKVAEMNKEKKTEDKGKKESRWIRNPKTRTLVRRTSQKGKQLLKIQARKDALIKKRFGDKKKTKK